MKKFFILFLLLAIVIFSAGCVGENGRNGKDGKNGKDGTNGINGINGLGTFDINTTFTTDAGTNANVVNIGNSTVAHFNFYIPKGLQGLQGEQGIQGIQGLKGDKGDTGLQGIQGEQGIQGIQGLKGDKGDTGLKGDKGDTGLKGDTGEKGDTGDNGYTPIFGVDYFNGSQGIQGEKGDKGDAGTTNYNLLENLPDLGIYWTGTNYNSSYWTGTNYNSSYWTGTNYNSSYWTGTNYNSSYLTSSYNATYDAKPTLSQIYPVGSVYISVSSTSPETLFGGSWSAFGAGRVLVGIDAGDTSFDVVEETGGSKTVQTGGTVGSISATGSSLVKGGTSSSVNAAAQTHTHSAPSFTGTSTSVVQPYIVVYMWKRTA
jgi:hypothetical protein